MPRDGRYDFNVFGWEDYEGNRHAIRDENDLPDSVRPHGVLVQAVNVDDPEDTHTFTVYTRVFFQDWAEWWVYIGAIMQGNYGLELA